LASAHHFVACTDIKSIMTATTFDNIIVGFCAHPMIRDTSLGETELGSCLTELRTKKPPTPRERRSGRVLSSPGCRREETASGGVIIELLYLHST